MSHIVCDDQFEEINIPVPWGRITGKWWGPKDMQPILALHGFQDNAGSFDSLAAILSKYDIAILCIDLPGHGLSSHYPNGMYYQLNWEGILIIRRIVKYFNWTSKLTLMGHSMGAHMSFLYSSVYRNEVEKFISFDLVGPFTIHPSQIPKKYGATIDSFLAYESTSSSNNLNYEYDDIAELMMETRHHALTQKACAALMKRAVKPYKEDGFYVFTRDPRLNFSLLILVTLEQALEFSLMINCEMLIIRALSGGTFDDNSVTLLNKLKASKNVEDHIVTGNHYVHLNDPKSVVEIVLNFLNS